MTRVAEQLKTLRLSVKKSQQWVADQIGTTQQSIFRFEAGKTFPSEKALLWYADYFDVSLDYIFGRTDKPQGKIYNNLPKPLQEDGEMRDFIEMCFDPDTAANAKLKEMLINLLEEDKKKITKCKIKGNKRNDNI